MIVEYKKLGEIDVMAKPFAPTILAEQIKTIWQQRCASNLLHRTT